MTNGQPVPPCPQCGSAAAVHSITELADLARMQLGQQPGQASGQVPGQGPGNPAGPQQGWAAEPVAGPVGRSGRGPVPGSQLPGPWPRRGMDLDTGDAIGQPVADVALGAVGGFLGRAVSRRVQKAVSERVLPAVAANKSQALNEQIAIAQKYPGICACLDDHAVFLAGGSRVLPMPNLATLTMQQADTMVAQLRLG